VSILVIVTVFAKKNMYMFLKCPTHSVPATLSYENRFLWPSVTSTALKHKIN
jgi:hypothetical protein